MYCWKLCFRRKEGLLDKRVLSGRTGLESSPGALPGNPEEEEKNYEAGVSVHSAGQENLG